MFKIPQLTPQLTKEFLLSKNTEETYMTTYLGIPVSKGLVISPLRSDKKPTASFYRNRKGELIFHDFGTSFHGNFIDVVMYFNQCSYVKALQIIAEDFGYIEKTSDRPKQAIKISNDKIETKTETVIQIEPQEFTEGELKWWKSFGISQKTLNQYKVYSCKSVFLNGNYYKSSSTRHYIFGYYGGKRNGTEMWRLYFPQNKNYRFLSNWPKELIQGARQLKMQIGSGLIITKSLKDVLLLAENNIPAIAPCSETVLMSKAQMNRLTNKTSNILYLGDNDLPGVKGANKYRKKFPFLRCVFIKRHMAKDISDLYKNLGKTECLEAIEELNNIFNDKTIRETKHFWVF